MVCIYCQGKTRVNNSRPQHKTNTTWRRHICSICSAVFTTIERPAYEQSLAVSEGTSHIVPFERDRLFLSIYSACKHRSTATADATALTATIIGKLLASEDAKGGTLRPRTIRTLVSTTLATFDHAAHIQYDAFHPIVQQ